MLKPEFKSHPELNDDCGYVVTYAAKRDIDFVALAAPTEILYESSMTVILLDFDGGVIPKGSAWSYESDLIYNPSDLTLEEQQRILDSVTHDFAPFEKIVVTTNEETYYNALPGKRTRLILTTTFTFYGTTAGGVAYTGSIKWKDDTPCFVFTSLLKFNVKHIQEAASHEIGHTLSLRHHAKWVDCILKSQYDYGTPELASIMGVGYNAKRVEWMDGPTKNACTDIQYATQIIREITN